MQRTSERTNVGWMQQKYERVALAAWLELVAKINEKTKMNHDVCVLDFHCEKYSVKWVNLKKRAGDENRKEWQLKKKEWWQVVVPQKPP